MSRLINLLAYLKLYISDGEVLYYIMKVCECNITAMLFSDQVHFDYRRSLHFILLFLYS